MNILLAMIPAFLWGTTYAITQYSLPNWPPLLLGALRALPAGLLLLTLKPSLPKKENWKNLCALGCLNIGIFFTCIFIMALTLPSAVSGVGMISVPVFAMLYHWVMTKKKPAFIQIISGIVLIALAWHLFNPGSITLSLVGLGAMLTAIMSLIVGSNLTKKMASDIHWWDLLTWQLIIGGSALLIISALHATMDTQRYFNAFNELTMLNIAGLAWLIIFATALAYGLYVWLLQKMTVVEFTFGGIANPIAGILAGYILMNEGFTSQQYSLMALMIATSLLPLAIAIIKRKVMIFIDNSRHEKV